MFIKKPFLVKISKKVVKQAEQSWNYVFTFKRWDEILPKENTLEMIEQAIIKPIQPKNGSEVVLKENDIVLKNAKHRQSEQLDKKTQNQVDFLYSIWSKVQKKQKIDVMREKNNSQMSKKRDNENVINTKNTKMAETIQTSTQNSSFYKIKHSRNNVTNLYNYVLRKDKTKFVCQEKEPEVCQFSIFKENLINDNMEEESMSKRKSLYSKVAVSNLVIELDDPQTISEPKQEKEVNPLNSKQMAYIPRFISMEKRD